MKMLSACLIMNSVSHRNWLVLAGWTVLPNDVVCLLQSLSLFIFHFTWQSLFLLLAFRIHMFICMKLLPQFTQVINTLQTCFFLNLLKSSILFKPACSHLSTCWCHAFLLSHWEEERLVKVFHCNVLFSYFRFWMHIYVGRLIVSNICISLYLEFYMLTMQRLMCGYAVFPLVCSLC